MNILKAYTEAGSAGGQNFGMMPPRDPATETKRENTQVKSSGDSVRISSKAMELLENGAESLSVCPQDATYDQYGNVTRQIDALNSDLNKLSRLAYPVGAGIAAQVNAMRPRVASIRAMI